MGLIKNWIKIKIFNGWVWVAVNLLGAKANRANIVKEYQETPQSIPASPCEMCRDYVQIAGRPIHVSQIKAIEDEWVREKIIN